MNLIGYKYNRNIQNKWGKWKLSGEVKKREKKREENKKEWKNEYETLDVNKYNARFYFQYLILFSFS